MPDEGHLFARWELGALAPADDAALAELLRDPQARRAFVRHARVGAALAAAPPMVGPPAPVAARSANRGRRAIRRARAGARPRWIALATLILVAVIGATLLLRSRDRPAPALARIAAVDGAARVTRAGGTSEAAVAGSSLTGSDTIDVERGSLALELAGDAAALDLAAGTRLRLGCDGTSVELAAGRLAADVAPRGTRAPLAVVTPHARAEIAGTRFALEITGDATRLDVTDGEVRFAAAGASDLLVPAGRAALAADGMVTFAPAPPGPTSALPAGSRVLWRLETPADPRWRTVVEGSGAGMLLRSVRPLDPTREFVEFVAEVRTPEGVALCTVEPGTYLRFRIHAEGLPADAELQIKLKPTDLTNFAASIDLPDDAGWRTVTLRVDGAFRHLTRADATLQPGEPIHGVVWAVRSHSVARRPVRFWLHDVAIVASPAGLVSDAAR